MPASIAQILELTDAVEQAIDEGDWLHAGQLNADRHALLRNLFADGAPHLGVEEKAALRDVLNRNDAVVGKLGADRDRVAAAASRMRQGNRAVNSYRQNAARVTADA